MWVADFPQHQWFPAPTTRTPSWLAKNVVLDAIPAGRSAGGSTSSPPWTCGAVAIRLPDFALTMLGLQDLTVGQVSGMIAAAVFIGGLECFVVAMNVD